MQHASPTPIVGSSAQTRALLGLVKVLAGSVSTVLITGESGTGKELVAQALHRQSPRRQGPFVPINCGAIPRDLLESELFGHRKGSFTGAVNDRTGRFEMADGGTLFLDEIGDLPLDMQVKLLRVLQDRCIHPVGATKAVSIDVRVVAATHKDLVEHVAQGKFREDLYYRLNVLPCQTAALRERAEDIPELLSFYAKRHAPQGQVPIRFGAGLLQALCDYAWPGNVRELSNLVDRFTTLFPGQQVELSEIPLGMLPPGLRQRPVAVPVHAAHEAGSESADDALFTLLGRPDQETTCFPLPPGGLDEAGRAAAAANLASELAPPSGDLPAPTPNVVEEIVCLAQGIVSLPPEGVPLKQQLVRIERSLIEQALERTNGNVSQTARLLHLQRTTLIEKIQKYELRVG